MGSCSFNQLIFKREEWDTPWVDKHDSQTNEILMFNDYVLLDRFVQYTLFHSLAENYMRELIRLLRLYGKELKLAAGYPSLA